MRRPELDRAERVADYSSAVLDLLAYFLLCSLVVLVVLFSVGVLTAAPPVEFVVVANKADPRQSPSSTKTQSPAASSAPATKVASGHTHTCSKGHTWDHTMDGGSHRCPFCGESNFVVSNRTHVTSLSTTEPSYQYSLSQSYSGCSGPGCATSSPTPSRAVGWRIFRR